MSVNRSRQLVEEAEESRGPAVSVLVVDDQAAIRESMVITFRREGYAVESAESGEEALDLLYRKPFDLVVTDLRLTGINGLEVLRRTKELFPDTEVVVMTAYGTIEGAVEAIKAGAYDYLTKPFQPEELTLVSERALERKGLTQRVRLLEQAVRGRHPFEEIVCASAAMSDVLKMIEQVARLDSTILITGESGTGKELAARALHALSPRKDKPLVIVNCGAIPENLQESELFGHTKGLVHRRPRRQARALRRGPRGHRVSRRGRRAHADGPGEDAAVSPERRGPAGGHDHQPQPGRADHRGDQPRSGEEREGRKLPGGPLLPVERHPHRAPAAAGAPEDIPPLAQHFVRRISERMGTPQPPAISPRAMDILMKQPWRGNVRELENCIERASALDRDGILGMDDLPFGRLSKERGPHHRPRPQGGPEPRGAREGVHPGSPRRVRRQPQEHGEAAGDHHGDPLAEAQAIRERAFG